MMLVTSDSDLGIASVKTSRFGEQQYCRTLSQSGSIIPARRGIAKLESLAIRISASRTGFGAFLWIDLLGSVDGLRDSHSTYARGR